MEVILVVLWLVFTPLLITQILTHFAVLFFLLQSCFLLLIILQALMTWSWNHAGLPVPFLWVRSAAIGAVAAWPGLNLTAHCFFSQVFAWVWFDFLSGKSHIWQQIQLGVLRAFQKIALILTDHCCAAIIWRCTSWPCPFAAPVISYILLPVEKHNTCLVNQ